MIYPRKLKKHLLGNLDNELILVITGMRRVGKTYLLQDIYNEIQSENKLIFDLERDADLLLFKENSYAGIERNLQQRGLHLLKKAPGEVVDLKHRAYIFIDEIQYYRKLTSILKYLVDHFQIKFIVTGSSSFYLKNYFSESLAGRKLVFNLHSLDFGEYLLFKGEQSLENKTELGELIQLHTEYISSHYEDLFMQYLQSGGFPQVVLAKSRQDWHSILHEVIASYISIDVRTMTDIKKTDDFRKLISLLIPRVGQKLDISKLSRITGLARETIARYLAFMEDTFVIGLVRPYSKSPDREISSVPKLYFSDHGLAGALGGLSDGQRLENYVYCQLKNFYQLNYYQRKSGPEIDFIVNKKTGVEVKSFGDESNLYKLSRLSHSIGLKNYFIVAQKQSNVPSELILPAYLLGFLEMSPIYI
ncbi:MAG: ATP-binding protein [Candidatus Roizmanbacteria bacterium]|nr:ATP-binding protein [Candidatus Roizmanbacteria bacterium]